MSPARDSDPALQNIDRKEFIALEDDLSGLDRSARYAGDSGRLGSSVNAEPALAQHLRGGGEGLKGGVAFGRASIMVMDAIIDIDRN